MQPKRRRFRGYAVLDERGSLIWGTMHPESKKSRELFEKWNPTVGGYDHGEKLASIEITLTK